MYRIGLIADTHGLLRPEAASFLSGCDHIIHAGDIGGDDVLHSLSRIARVTAVRGNNDTGPWAADLPLTQSVVLGGISVFVLHDIQDLKLYPPPHGSQLVVCGHSHKAQVRPLPTGQMLVNPGSAGPRRFKLPVTAAELLIRGAMFEPRIVPLLQSAS